MTSAKFTWYKIAGRVEELQFGENQIAVAEIEGRKLCIGLHQGKMYAFNYFCPHAGGLFEKGHIDVQGNVVCPVHCYRFNIKNGYNSSGEGYHLRNWPVEERADGIFVRIEDGSGFLRLVDALKPVSCRWFFRG